MKADTLNKLQQPTFSLIASFYPMPDEIQSHFVTMLALYERHPTPDHAAFLFDKVTGKETPEEKKQWFSQQESALTLQEREEVTIKYITNRGAVPKGLPTSGNMLVGLGVVSRADKDQLMEAQAAARILRHLEMPDQIHLSQELFAKDGNGQIAEARAYLDKPFSTPIQRLEHLCAIMAGYQVIQSPYRQAAERAGNLATDPDIQPALTEFHKAALATLYRVSDKLSAASQPVAAQIREVAEAYLPREEVQDWSLKPIAAGMKEILPCLFTWHAPHLDKSKVNPCEDSYSPAERELVTNLIQKRLTQVQSGLSIARAPNREPEK